MNEMIKKALPRAAIGLALGLVIAGGFSLLGEGRPRAFMGLRGNWAEVLYYAYCGLMGAVNMGGQVIYEIEEWGVTRCTVVHFLLSMTTLAGLFLSMGHPMPGDDTFWIMLAACVMAYFIIWLIYYTAYRRKIRQMNEELKKWRSKRTP